MSRLTEVVRPLLLPESWVWNVSKATENFYKTASLRNGLTVKIKLVDFGEDSSWQDSPIEVIGYDVNPPVTGFNTLEEAMLYVEAWMLTGGGSG